MKRISILALIQLLLGAACAWSQQSATATARTDHAAPITFSSDIATIIYEKCSACHRPGQVGPFSLLTYDDVRKRASTIEAVIEDDYMPPWKPINHNVQFSNDRSLNKSQKEMLQQWIAAGCPEGDRALIPSPPEFPEGWSGDKIDANRRLGPRLARPILFCRAGGFARRDRDHDSDGSLDSTELARLRRLIERLGSEREK